MDWCVYPFWWVTPSDVLEDERGDQSHGVIYDAALVLSQEILAARSPILAPASHVQPREELVGLGRDWTGSLLQTEVPAKH